MLCASRSKQTETSCPRVVHGMRVETKKDPKIHVGSISEKLVYSCRIDEQLNDGCNQTMRQKAACRARLPAPGAPN